MKRLLPVTLILCTLIIFLVGKADAQITKIGAKPSFKTDVEAKVGNYYLNISGWISPYASVVLYSDGVFLRATVADSKGNFYISQVLIKEGFSNFCLEAIDFKRIGESYTCFNIPPAKGNVEKHGIFLPPTLGLSRNEIGENEEVMAFGYTMPGARVKLYLSDGQVIETTADETGYYEYKLKGLKAGKYKLYAKATYQNKESLAPTKTLELRSLNWWEMFLAFLKELWNKVVKFITSIGLGPLWIGLPIIILIIILILKIWPEKFTFIYDSKLLAWLPRRKKKQLHHSWFIGY